MSAPKPSAAPLPIHADPEINRLSYAPYNFVPLPDAVLPAAVAVGASPPWEAHDHYLAGTHTGWIDLVLKAETPLYVRCAPPTEEAAEANPVKNRHRQHFFHHGDPERPVLPGSSLRGMIRSLVEIVAFARFSPELFSDRPLIYRAVADTTSLGAGYRTQMLGPNQDTPPRMRFEYPLPRLRGGWLRQRGSDWFIQPAREINGETFVHVEYDAAGIGPHDERRPYSDADLVDVFLKPPVERTVPPRRIPSLALRMAYISDPADVVRAKRDARPPEGFVSATVVRSGHMDGKHLHCAVYDPDRDQTWIPIPRELWVRYEEDRDLSRGIPARELQDRKPLFYLLDESGNLVFFGPTMMFRLPYPNTVGNLVPNRIKQLPGAQLDLAEAMFGTVAKNRAVKSRVFVEDAPWDGLGLPFLELGERGRRTPYILGSPKPTAFQHYLVQPNVKMEDGTFRPAGADPKGRTLCTYHHRAGGGPFYFTDAEGFLLAETEGTVIRGTKCYWHQPKITDPFRFRKDLARPEDTQLTIIRPVRPGTTFKGRVRFENLTDVELGALLTVLQLKPSQRHHLGMGKPFGLGSVRIEATPHLIDRSARYSCLFGSDGKVANGAIDATEIAQRCRQAFESAVRTHYRATAAPATTGRPNPPLTDLWSIPRLRALAALLEWDNAPPFERTGYEPPLYAQPPGTKTGDLGWWRQRLILPTPEMVARRETPREEAPPRERGPERDRGRGRDRERGRDHERAPKTPSYTPGQQIVCVLQEEKTKAGNWKAIIKGTEILGDVIGTPPGEAAAGQEVTLVLRFITPPKSASFYWPDSVPKPKKPGGPKSA